MRTIMLMIAGLLLGSGDLAHAQDVPAAEETPVIMWLNKVELDTEAANTSGSVKGGTMCVSSDKFTWSGFGESRIVQGPYQRRFVKAMEATGFKVLDGSKNLFAGAAASDGGGYSVGVILWPRNVEICLTMGGRIKGLVESDVQFQLFDNTTKQVVHTVIYSGKTEYPKFREDANFGTMLADSFGDAAAKFAADPAVLARAP